MDHSSLPKPLRGIIPPLVTPLAAPGRLDAPAIERLIEHVLAGGVHGLFVLGSTGEGPSLSPALRSELIRRVCGQAAGRVPVLVAISDTCFSDSVRLGGEAGAAGAAGLVLAPPYYFATSQVEFLKYLERIARELPLPLLLYNAPSFTKFSFELDTVRQAAALPNVVGLKDSSGDRIYFHHLQYALKDRPDFSLFVGPEELLAEVLLFGGHGGVSGGANLWPKLYVELYNAAVSRDLERVVALHDLIMYINTQLYGLATGFSGLLRAMKCALSLLGICDDFMAQPFQAFGQPERDAVRRCVKEFEALSRGRTAIAT